MKASISDIVMHIDENLDAAALDQLERGIRHGSGVISAGHRPGRNHLMVVAYDSALTRAIDVLDNVRKSGVHAQLIGM